MHDLQSAYRKLLHAMSRPGIVTQLDTEIAKLERTAPCYPSTQLMALMLLDTEVSFSVVSPQATELARRFSQLTYAKAVSCNDADYIFVLADALGDALEHALAAAKSGHLINPALAATVVIEAKAITPGQGLALSGPGILGVHRVDIKTGGEWLGQRKQQVREYPLGIDLVFLDPGGGVVCIPRTTAIEERVTDGICSC